MTDDKWEKQVMKKVRFMTNYIWNGINFSDVEAFLANFGDDKTVGLALLDMLIYYSCEQEEFIIENLVRLLNRDLWISKKAGERNQSIDKIKEGLRMIYSQMCFVPVKDHDPSDSAFSLSSMYKKSECVPRTIEFIEVEEVPLMIAMQKKFFVFYDDIIGTGKQFRDFWSVTNHFGKHDVTLKAISERNPDVQFYYLVFGGYKKSIDMLEEQFPNLKIIVSEVFTSDYSVFDDANEYWEFNKDKKELVLDFINKKENELKSKSPFSLNLPLLFQHSRASNTSLSLYWFEKQGKWKELYRR